MPDSFDKRGFHCSPSQITKNDLTWAYWADAGKPGCLDYYDMITAFEAAAAEWVNWRGGISIIKVDMDSSPPPDVLMRWNMIGEKDNNPFFEDAVVAFATHHSYTEFPCMPRMIVLQGLEQVGGRYQERSWSLSQNVPGSAHDVQSVVLHEWGHILYGAGHFFGPAVMQQGGVGRGLAARQLTTNDSKWADANTGGLVK